MRTRVHWVRFLPSAEFLWFFFLSTGRFVRTNRRLRQILGRWRCKLGLRPSTTPRSSRVVLKYQDNKPDTRLECRVVLESSINKEVNK